jgi:hypothetical protein
MPQTPESIYLVSFALIILMKIICFILGYKTIKLGYNLITAGVKGEFKFSSSFAGFKADLVSVSPGLLFVVLGIMLITIAVYTKKNVTYHNNTYKTPVADSAKTTNPHPLLKDLNADTLEMDSIFH